MADVISQLIENLKDSEGVYLKLLPILEEEKEAVFSSDPDKFSHIVAEKEELLAYSRQLERNRQHLLNRVSSNLRVPIQTLRLSFIANAIDSVQSSQIRRLQISLNRLMTKVKRANEENRHLIQHCLRIVRSTLGFFQHWTMPKDIYGASGQMNIHQKNGHLISGAV